MVNFTKQLTQKQFDFIKSKLKRYQITTKSQYIIFSADYLQTKINIYTSLKLVVQGKNVEKVLEYLTISIPKQEPVDEVNYSYIGCDETGNGSYFGGIYCAAAFVHKDTVPILRKLGITDSKKLTDEQMLKLERKVADLLSKRKIKIMMYCQVVQAIDYNECYSFCKNANVVKAMTHNRTISVLKYNMRLGAKENPPLVDKDDLKFGTNTKIVMDEFVNRNKYYAYLDDYSKKLPNKIDIFTPNAESKYIAVALASICARVAYLRDVDRMQKELGFKIPLGSASKQIIEAAKKIDPKDRHKYIKLHFKNTNDLN